MYRWLHRDRSRHYNEVIHLLQRYTQKSAPAQSHHVRTILTVTNSSNFNSGVPNLLASVPRPFPLRVIVCVCLKSLPRTINTHNNFAYWGRPGTEATNLPMLVIQDDGVTDKQSSRDRPVTDHYIPSADWDRPTTDEDMTQTSSVIPQVSQSQVWHTVTHTLII